MPDWKKLRVGDRIRIIAVPAGDQAQYKETKRTFTVRVLWRLIAKRTIVTINRIDEYAHPWFDYTFKNHRGRLEYHSLTVCDDDSWRRVRPRSKKMQIEQTK